MSDSILLEIEGGIAHVTLNRPHRLNAIDADAAARWRDIAAVIAGSDEVRAVLLDAAGPAFCAGGDIAAMAHVTDGAGGRVIAELADVIHEGHRVLAGAAKPIVAAVNGAVAGGGLGFMLVADVIVAGERASFVSKYADVGLTPDCGVSTLLPEAVGMRRALDLLLTPRVLDAREALDWGLVTEVTPDPDVRARTIAESWASGPFEALGQARRLLRGSQGRAYADALDDEARTIGAAFDTDAAKRRISAFVSHSTSRPTD